MRTRSDFRRLLGERDVGAPHSPDYSRIGIAHTIYTRLLYQPHLTSAIRDRTLTMSGLENALFNLKVRFRCEIHTRY
jgi:hypothetical protein